MNLAILHEEVQTYIDDNLTKDIHKILLKKSPFPKVSSKELVEQIESKKKSKKKLNTWFSTSNIYYPNKLNLSQTSSEITAGYKTTLIDGETIADLTAGFGVDSAFFARKRKKVIHIEKNKILTQIAKHNFTQLELTNVEFFNTDAIDFLKDSDRFYDWIYIDPSRRDQDNKKVYYLSDCEPDLTKHLDLLFTRSDNILIKTGPLLDLNVGISQLTFVKEIHIVAVSNEVKEVLWVLSKNYNQGPLVKTINFQNNAAQNFNYELKEEKIAKASYALPQAYLYEPNAAILKAGAFELIATRYKVNKLHPNSHLYTSKELINFPGRTFKIKSTLNYSRKEIKKLGISKANITTRNFPDSVEKVRGKLKIKDGGTDYLFCTTLLNEKKIILNCHKI